MTLKTSWDVSCRPGAVLRRRPVWSRLLWQTPTHCPQKPIMRFSTILLFTAFVGGCASSATAIHAHPVPPFVVSSVVVAMPPASAASAVMGVLNLSKQRSDSFYRQYGFRGCAQSGISEPVFAFAEDLDHALFGMAFFADPANSRALYVAFMGMPIQSSFYYSDDGPACYSTKFAISIEPAAPAGSLVSVRSIDPTVSTGREFNAHALGFVPSSRAVAASPTEEYRLLVYVARSLGTSLRPL